MMNNEMGINTGDRHPEMVEAMNERFNTLIENGGKLFTTNVDNYSLFETYLMNISEDTRQESNCNCCKNFIRNYGGLVTITNSGEIESVLWDGYEIPSQYKQAVDALKNTVLKAKVNGVFLSELKTLGQPLAGGWAHFAVNQPNSSVYRRSLLTAGQAMAEKKQDFLMLINALLEYPVDAVDQAVTLLKSESLYRSEKILGVAEWFKNLHDERNNTKNSRHKENIVWQAVATAPVGFTHIKSSMIGTLLDDIVSGMSFETVSRRFAAKMSPLQYQRPQVAPSTGNIAQAEKIIEKLGISKSLSRRFARLEELQTMWSPKEKKEEVKSGGIFSHLQAKDAQAKTQTKMEIPAVSMTWRKFAETVLPFADEIEYLVKSGNDNYSAILTALHEDAPPILQWDSENQRNPFSWYVYNNGTSYSKWGLNTGYCKVTGITLQPSMWHEENAYQGKSVFLILEGAKDNRKGTTGNALFPETLKSELREIRSTIEAYSRGESIEGYDEASACGIRLQYGSDWSTTIRVTTKTGTAIYKLDRWD